ncbi:MAG: rhomboid family intramembrane serine protease [Myxococcota bacterium]
MRASRGYLVVAVGVALALIGFWGMTGQGGPWRDLFARGSADSGAILSGEWWRAVTSLTLHGGAGHVLSNAAALAVFLGAVCMTLGAGLGSLAVLLAGAAGNLLNAALHGAPHAAAGASTAVFGAVGLLGGMAVARRVRSGTRGRRAWVPMVAGLGLLAMLGTSGERVDLWAHLLGLLAGGILGLPLGLRVLTPPESRTQWGLGGGALALVFYCWIRALS